MEHEGRAVVFENVEDLARAHRQRRPRRHGRRRPGAEEHRPEGRAGHARGRLPADPAASSRAPGVKDMVRISDGRMSGTAVGTIVLHVTPESAIGGPLAQVRNGDRIRLSVQQARDQPAGVATPNWRSARGRTRSRRRPPSAATASCSCSGDAGRPGRRLRLPAPPELRREDSTPALVARHLRSIPSTTQRESESPCRISFRAHRAVSQCTLACWPWPPAFAHCPAWPQPRTPTSRSG